MGLSKSESNILRHNKSNTEKENSQKHVNILVEILPEQAASLSLWAALQSDNPDLSEAIRRIINDIELCSADTLADKIQESRRRWRRIWK